MDSFQLTPRQLLILLLTACRDAGYNEVPRQLVNETLYEMRTSPHPSIPKFVFMLSSMKRFSLDLDRGFASLQGDGSIVIDETGLISIAEHLSCTATFKAIPYESILIEQINPYVSDFVGRVIPSLACIPPRPEIRDPRVS